MGYLKLLGSTVIKLSPDKSEIPFLNFPKIKNARYCFVRQKKHCSGITNPTFSYRFKSPELISNSFLQSTQILVSVFVFINIDSGRTYYAPCLTGMQVASKHVTLLNHTG